jgi:hypothetical protein
MISNIHTMIYTGQMRAARVGLESAYDNPRPGDQIRVSYLMNVVTALVRR